MVAFVSQVIGQFNLGFIIGKLDPDLFIVDQFWKRDVEENQSVLYLCHKHLLLHIYGRHLAHGIMPLFWCSNRPVRLELSPEEVVVFNAYGINQVQSSIGCGSSHSFIIVKNGFVLEEDPHAPLGHHFKLSAVPFSKNITFGLEVCVISQILEHLADLKSPWNCPHGRPTMRHLVDLTALSKDQMKMKHALDRPTMWFAAWSSKYNLPLSLLKTAQGHPMLVELKNGETYNGHLVNCDTWMNIHLREVIWYFKGTNMNSFNDGDRFWRMPECYIRGNTIKYLRVPDEVIDKVQEEAKSRADRRPSGVGRGRGRGREDGPGGRQPKGVGRGLDDGAKSAGGGRGRGGSGGKTSGSRVKELQFVSKTICSSSLEEKGRGMGIRGVPKGW
ncbi:hypothetical protein CRYUN_Cryun14cG0087800 [Craigia yunnanensis]